jgi:hypothetical protein
LQRSNASTTECAQSATVSPARKRARAVSAWLYPRHERSQPDHLDLELKPPAMSLQHHDRDGEIEPHASARF